MKPVKRFWKKFILKLNLIVKKPYHLVYVIPIYRITCYDQIKCAEYCYDRLKKNGFIVLYTYPNLLFVSWEHVPSTLKNPDVKPLEHEFATNPYKDYSNIVYQISNIQPKQPQIEYLAPSQDKYLLNGSNSDMTLNDFRNEQPKITGNNYGYNNFNQYQPPEQSNYGNKDPYNKYPHIDNNHSHIRNKTLNFFSMLEDSK